MARITYYKNSILASIVSIMGYMSLFSGVIILVDGEILGGVTMGIVGIALAVVAAKISESKAFRKWWKQVEKNGLVPEIRNSRDVAVTIYQKNPQKKTLEKIRKLNPAAAAYIEGGCREPVQQPVQRPAQQKPVQQPVQQPVYQQPVYQQPVYQQPVQASQRFDVRKFEQDVLADIQRARVADGGKGLGDVYSNAISQVYGIYRENLCDAALAQTAVKLCDDYMHLSCDYNYENYRDRFDTVQKAIELQDAFSLPATTRRFYLIHSAVHGGLTAGQTKNRNSMHYALEMLQVASESWMELNRPVDQHYMQVSIPTIRCWLLYLLAESYSREQPVDYGYARTLVQCANRFLIKTPVLMSDMNPHLDWNKNVVLTQDMLHSLERSIP